MLGVKFHNSRLTESTLLILIPFIVSKYAFFYYTNGHIFSYVDVEIRFFFQGIIGLYGYCTLINIVYKQHL